MMYLLFAESQLCPPTRTRPGEGTIYSACIAYQQCKDRTDRSEEHTSELQSRLHLVCRLLLEKKKNLRIASECEAPDSTLIGVCNEKTRKFFAFIRSNRTRTACESTCPDAGAAGNSHVDRCTC